MTLAAFLVRSEARAVLEVDPVVGRAARDRGDASAPEDAEWAESVAAVESAGDAAATPIPNPPTTAPNTECHC